jgi:hypothetical protein
MTTIKEAVKESVKEQVRQELLELIQGVVARQERSAVYCAFKEKNDPLPNSFKSVCTGSLSYRRDLECLMFWPTVLSDPYNPTAADELCKNPLDPNLISKFLSSTQDYDVHCRAFLGWLLSDEVFGKTFLTDSIEDAFHNGVEIDLDQYIHIVQPALIMMRRMYEYPSKVSAWFYMVERGVNPRSAAMIAEGVRKGISTAANHFWYLSREGQGHRAFSCAISKRDIQNIALIKPVVDLGEDTVPRMNYRNSYKGRPSFAWSSPGGHSNFIIPRMQNLQAFDQPHWGDTLTVNGCDSILELCRSIVGVLEQHCPEVIDGPVSDQDGIETPPQPAEAD